MGIFSKILTKFLLRIFETIANLNLALGDRQIRKKVIESPNLTARGFGLTLKILASGIK